MAAARAEGGAAAAACGLGGAARAGREAAVERERSRGRVIALFFA